MSAKTFPTQAKPAVKQLGCYLYAVIDAVIDDTTDREWARLGIDGCLVYTISNGPVAAVVSDLPNGKIRPERRRLAAHHDVLKRLMAKHTVLPMAFGLIADGPAAIRRILSVNRTGFAEQFRRVAGKVEMGLRVQWDVPNIFEYFVNTHSELRLFRDRLFRDGREPGPEEKIELGRLFDRTLASARLVQSEQVMNVLRRCCDEIKENPPRNEREVMNLACLIGRDAQKEFEQGVFEAAALFDNHYSFDFNGPWPPHNFVEVTLQT